MAQHLSASFTPPPITEIGKYRFEKLVEYADRKGVRVAFENIYTLENLAWAMERFGKGSNVGLCWDCGHEYCFTQGVEIMKLWGDRLICTHIHDNECILDKDRHMLPFDGAIDFERVAEHLRNYNYTGTLMFEVIANGNHCMYDPFSVEEYLVRAADAAKRLAKMVDQELPSV